MMHASKAVRVGVMRPISSDLQRCPRKDALPMGTVMIQMTDRNRVQVLAPILGASCRGRRHVKWASFNWTETFPMRDTGEVAEVLVKHD